MSAPLWGALATAGVLGVTHAIEPDHVAGISSVTSRYGDSRLSALVGACFSLGHVALVVVWLVGGYRLLGRTEYPAVFDTVGTLGVAVLLGVLGSAMAVGGLRSMRHTHVHEHGDELHAHPHLHLPLTGSDHGHSESADDGHLEGTDQANDGAVDHTHDGAVDHTHDGAVDNAHDGAVDQAHDGAVDQAHDGLVYEFPRIAGDDDGAAAHGHADHESTDAIVPHAHGHGVGAYLKTGVVGALFTLSPPLSMILFASTLFPEYGAGAVALAVATYAVSITATMSAIGAGVGTLFGASAVSPRLHAGARAAGGVVVVGFAVSMLPGTVF